MAAIRRVMRTEQYQQLAMDETRIRMNETNDCTVIATAAVTGMTYAEAHAAMAAVGRKHRQGFSRSLMVDKIIQMGFEVRRVNPRDVINGFPGRAKGLQNLTTHHPVRYPRHWPKGNFIMFTAAHVTAVVDGRVHDWAVNNSLRVVSMYLVTRKAVRPTADGAGVD